MRVLFGWEFGAGLGHVTRFRPIAERLSAQGAEVLCALQELRRADAFNDRSTGAPFPGVRVIQAPRNVIPNDPKLRQVPTDSLADIFTLIRFGDPQALARRIADWRALISDFAPDVVIGDFAPSLMLAARGRVPRIAIGNGYTTPPSGRVLPPIRPWQTELAEFSIAHEQTLLEQINGVLSTLGDPPIGHLADALNGDESFVFTLSLVDPYAAHRTTATWAPFNMPTGIRPKPLSARRARSVFLYLPKGHTLWEMAFDALAAADVDGEAFISDLAPEIAAARDGAGVTLHRSPQDFATLLPSLRLVVHHGGLSTAVAALLAGTPQLILPWNLEHLVTAQGVAKTGGTEVVPPNRRDQRSLTNAMNYLAGDKAIAKRALAAARTVDLGDPEAGITAMLDSIRSCTAPG